MKKYRLTYGALLLISIVIYIVTDTQLALIWLLVLIALLAVSGVCLLVGSKWVTVSVRLAPAGLAKRRHELILDAGFPARLPLGGIRMRLSFENILFGETWTQDVVLKPSGAQGSYVLPLTGLNCGKLLIRRSQGSCMDFLGVFGKKLPKDPRTREIYLYPELSELEMIQKHFPEAKNMGTSYDSKTRGSDVTEVYDVRDYMPGDSVKSIHWKLSGKLDRLIIREFGNPFQYHTLVSFDLQTDASESSQADQIRNEVIGLAASVSRSLITHNYPHHFAAWNQADGEAFYVDSMNNYEQMVDGILSTRLLPLKENPENWTLQSQLRENYTKLILVTGSAERLGLASLASLVNVTAICLKPDGAEQVEQGRNYNVITLPISSKNKNIQALEI